uniref:Uncharacterized protein n=1 Tax=Arundo donax TaxID=35708 RepID=A0A0A8ZZ30_ARUDO
MFQTSSLIYFDLLPPVIKTLASISPRVAMKRPFPSPWSSLLPPSFDSVLHRAHPVPLEWIKQLPKSRSSMWRGTDLLGNNIDLAGELHPFGLPELDSTGSSAFREGVNASQLVCPAPGHAVPAQP